jgi:hypothetical protein
MKCLTSLRRLVIEISHSNASESNGVLEITDFLEDLYNLEEMSLTIGPVNKIGPNGC